MLQILFILLSGAPFLSSLLDVQLTDEPSAAELLEKAIYTEQTVGDLDAALLLYEKIVTRHELNEVTAAQAQFRIGLAHLRRGDRIKAAAAFARLAEKYPGQKDLVRQSENLMPPVIDEALEQIRENYVDVIEDDGALTETALRAVLGNLDEFSGFVSEEELKQLHLSISGDLVGIGVRINLEDDRLMVISPLRGSPALAAGVASGDQIVAIDGVAVADMTEANRLAQCVKLLRGKADTKVVLSVVSQTSDQPSEITVVRNAIRIDSIVGDMRNEDGTWQFHVAGEPTIGYIRILRFGKDSADEIRAIVRQLEQRDIKGLVIDIRMCPGGFLPATIEVVDLFLDNGTILDVKGRKANTQTFAADSAELLSGVPIAILVTRKTASAAEILVGALKDHGRATIIGERTFGKGTVQELFPLRSGGAIKLTTARFYLPGGSGLQKPAEPEDNAIWGVDPSEGFEISLTEDDLKKYREYREARDVIGGGEDVKFSDEALKRATEFLKNRDQD